MALVDETIKITLLSMWILITFLVCCLRYSLKVTEVVSVLSLMSSFAIKKIRFDFMGLLICSTRFRISTNHFLLTFVTLRYVGLYLVICFRVVVCEGLLTVQILSQRTWSSIKTSVSLSPTKNTNTLHLTLSTSNYVRLFIIQSSAKHFHWVLCLTIHCYYPCLRNSYEFFTMTDFLFNTHLVRCSLDTTQAYDFPRLKLFFLTAWLYFSLVADIFISLRIVTQCPLFLLMSSCTVCLLPVI